MASLLNFGVTYGKGVAQELAARHGAAWPAGTGPDSLSRRTGRLTQALISSVRVRGDTLETIEAEMGAGPFGAIHENGAVIRPKKGRYLTVPLPAALDGRGFPLKRSAREWDNTFVAQSRRGNLLIFQRQGAVIIPLYVLKESVTIPRRLGLRQEVEKQLPHFMERTVDRLMAEVLAGSSKNASKPA